MRRTVPRQNRVLQRCDQIVRALEDNGPMEVTAIAKAIGMSVLRTRYALSLLRNDHRVHVHSHKSVTGVDGVDRLAAVLAAGDGPDDMQDDMTLDFYSTAHLQPIYVAWAKTRTPDWRLDPSYHQTPGVSHRP